MTRIPLAPRRRGRPPKFGRPARLVAITLPHDVLDWLGSIDPDLGKAVVALFDAPGGKAAPPRALPPSGAEIVEVGRGRGLILVSPNLVRDVTGVDAIPFGEGRAFLALEPSWTTADLELAVVDVLERGVEDRTRRSELSIFRGQLRALRTDPSVRLTQRSIIVVERGARRQRKRDES